MHRSAQDQTTKRVETSRSVRDSAPADRSCWRPMHGWTASEPGVWMRSDRADGVISFRDNESEKNYVSGSGISRQ